MHPLIIIFLTLFGVAVLLWLVFGINWRSSRNYERKHRRLHARMQAEDTEALQRLLFSNSLTMRVEQRFRPLAILLAQNGRPSVAVSDMEIITSGRRKYDLLIGDILNAKESIHVEYYHFGIDKSSRRIRRLLMAKARQGVKVRFINENIANWPIPNLYFRSMRKAGVELVNFSDSRFSLLRFLITLSYRDHRKIVVIDNRIGYTGGMNINDHYFYQWRDTHLRLTGEAVASLQYAFLDTWLAAGGQLYSAVNSFFFHFSGEFMHSKTIVCDDYLSCIGSANLDYRSFGIDYEINTFFYDRAVALQQKQIFENDLPICRLVIAAEAHPTPWQRLMRHLAPIV